MSYPKDLDEYTQEELKAELTRRQLQQSQGNCDYCGRKCGAFPPCKFHERHGPTTFKVEYTDEASGLSRQGEFFETGFSEEEVRQKHSHSGPGFCITKITPKA